MSLGLRAYREVAILAGLVIASIVTFARGKALPPKLRTYRAARTQLSNLLPVPSIRTWNDDRHTRVVIDVGSEVKYRSARISEPDRIYFDIEGPNLDTAMVQKPTDVGVGPVKGVRAAQNRPGVLRVVLDVYQVKDYSVSLLADPYRLVVDVYGASTSPKADAHNAVPPAGPPATYLPPVKTDTTATVTAAATPPKSTDTSAVKSPLVPSANASAAESQSLPALVPSTAPSSRTVPEPPQGKTERKPDKDSEKYFAAASQPSTAQEGEAAASAPARPVAAEQKAAKPAKVTYVDGQLTITAENSLLSDILSALHAAMGAEIDLPPSASGERIWVRLGPGPARKVVSELLSGTDLNFVIQGSATDAEGIHSVLLTPHSEVGAGNPGITSEPQERVASRQPPSGNPTAVEAPKQESPVLAETTTASSEPS